MRLPTDPPESTLELDTLEDLDRGWPSRNPLRVAVRIKTERGEVDVPLFPEVE